MKRRFAAIALCVVMLCGALLVSCGGGSDEKTLKIGATPAPHAAILEIAKEIMAKEGFTLEIVQFNDYITPNKSLSDGSLDANYFQHITYLNGYNEENGTDLVSAASIHFEPLGIYAGTAASLKDLKDGDKIAVPNDATNEARALLLLESNGLIKLRDGVGISATKKDVVENPHNYEFVELEARLTPTVLKDVAISVINGNFAIDSDLDINDALAVEAADGAAAEAYANVIAVRRGDENKPAVQSLIRALQSEEVKAFLAESYKNSVVPVY